MAENPYVHQSYPTMLYHAVYGRKVVKDPEEAKALGEGWVDSPAKLKHGSEVSETPEPWAKVERPRSRSRGHR